MRWFTIGFLAALFLAIVAVISWAVRSDAMEATENEPPAEPAPWSGEVYAILSIVTCTRCSQEPSGTCTCGIRCPHPACMFDHAPLTGLNRDELAFLRGERGMPEKRDAI